VKAALGERMDHTELRDRTATFAREVGAFAKPLLDTPGVRNASDQLLRAAESVASNYRAAGLARSDKEFASTIGVVLTEADESLYWLTNLKDAGFDNRQLLQEATELTRIFCASFQTAKRNLRNQKRKRRAR
jgi:four helix bundle protein